MSFIPLLTNVNHANYILKTSPNNDHYKIMSTYKTCFFKYACCNVIISLPNDLLKILNNIFFKFAVKSKSEMTFSSDLNHGGTKFRETIDYECPFILSFLCSRELAYQRESWMTNLKMVYHN